MQVTQAESLHQSEQNLREEYDELKLQLASESKERAALAKRLNIVSTFTSFNYYDAVLYEIFLFTKPAS